MFAVIALVLVLVAVVVFFVTRKKDSPEEEIHRVEVTSASGSSSGSKTVATTKVFSGPKVHVYFGSQTGTAEGFAHKLADEFRERDFDAKVIDLEEFDPDEFATQEIVVFSVASYGEGEPTDNARKFYKWLGDKTLEKDLLANTRFMVFGLGNRQYEFYQAMGLFVDKRMEELGGQRMFRRGDGDDDGSVEDDFNTWREEMWPAIAALFGLGDAGGVSKGRQYRYNIEWGQGLKPSKSSNSLDHHPTVNATVLCNNELHTSVSDRSCRHIELNLEGLGVRYETGDHVAIAQVNDADQVKALIARFQVDPNASFSLVSSDGTSPFPCPCTVSDAFSKYLEINSFKKAMLADIAEFATADDEEKRLRHLASKEGKNDFDKYSIKEMRTVVDLLNDFPSIDIPIHHFMELLPRMQPRYYSISSSAAAHPTKVHVTASVEHIKLPQNREFNGVCTRYLRNLRVGDLVPITLHTSSFKLPHNIATSCVMIGPGTGLAPIRGFLQELTYRKANGAALGQNILFFGCQNRDRDFIYEKEIMEAGKSGVLYKTHLAFSREQTQKVYVQHKLAEDQDTVLDVLNSGGCLYICGAVKMAKDVRATIVDAAIKKFGWTTKQADDWLQSLQQGKRFCQDVWG